MAEIVTDCPRCGAQRMTFDAPNMTFRYTKYDWKHYYEVYCVCRACKKSSIHLVSLKNTGLFSKQKQKLISFDGVLNPVVELHGPVTLKDNFTHNGPELLPDEIQAIYDEAVSCFAIGCYNAASTMLRLCLDAVTVPLLPKPDSDVEKKPNSKQRRQLGLRLEWMFENELLPAELRVLSDSIREDSNDGAHKGGLEQDDVEDLLDFCDALLERIITEPAKLKRAKERREKRRQNQS